MSSTYRYYKGTADYSIFFWNIEHPLSATMDPQQHSQNIQQQQHWQFASQQNQALVQQPGAAMSTQQMQYPPQQAQYGQANGYWAVQMPIQQMATTHTTTTTTTTNTATSAAQGGQGQWQQDQQYQGQAFATLPPQPQPQAVQWRQQYQHRKSTPTPPQPQQQAVQWQQEEQHHYNQQQHDLTQQQRFQNQQYQHSLQEPVQQQYQSPPQRMPPSAQIPAPNPPPPSRMDPTPPQQLVVQTPTLSASTANMQLGNTSNVVTTTQATRAERYQGEHAGGTARAEASRSGEQALVCFEQTVQALLSMVSRCPSGYPWYCDEDGYMCADGNHRVVRKLTSVLHQIGCRLLTLASLSSITTTSTKHLISPASYLPFSLSTPLKTQNHILPDTSAPHTRQQSTSGSLCTKRMPGS